VLELIIQEIEKRKIGRGSTKPWLRYRLSQIDYKCLQKEYQKDWLKLRYVAIGSKHNSLTLKLRSDYFPSASLFVLRMPGLLHEQLADDIVYEIRQQLRSIARTAGPAAEFAQRIRSTGSLTITSDDPRCGPHELNALFKHIDAKYTGVVMTFFLSIGGTIRHSYVQADQLAVTRVALPLGLATQPWSTYIGYPRLHHLANRNCHRPYSNNSIVNLPSHFWRRLNSISTGYRSVIFAEEARFATSRSRLYPWIKWQHSCHGRSRHRLQRQEGYFVDMVASNSS